MTKKLTRALLAFALVGGLSACNKENVNGTPEVVPSTGNTYMSVAVSTTLPADPLKAEDTSHNPMGDYAGRDKINDLTVYVVSVSDGKVEKKEFTNLSPIVGQANVYRTTAWKVDAGKKEVYVLVNLNGTPIKTALDNAAAIGKTAFETAYADSYDMTDASGVLGTYAKLDGGKDIIGMNGKTAAQVEVKGGVDQATAEAGTKNCAKINVRRLVAQAVVTKDAANDLTIKGTRNGATVTIATLSDLKWDVMQFEKKTYLDPMTSENGQEATKVKYCKTPSFEFIPASLNAFTTDAAGKYFYRAMTGIALGDFTRNASNPDNVTSIVGNTMKFITETTHQYGGKPVAEGGVAPETGYRKGNTAYAIISAQITPSNDTWATGQETGYAAGSDLFYGLNDGKFYKDKAAAKAANLNNDKNVLTYKGGLCYYVTWLNPNEVAKPLTSPVLRNNIYHVNIKAFKKVGYTGNPLTPGTENPKDPNDNTPDPSELLSVSETYMAVEATVVNWGVHSVDLEL